jgi:hypothetical protein
MNVCQKIKLRTSRMQKVKLSVCIFCVSHWVRWPEAVRSIVLSGEGRAESFHDCAVSIQHLISPLRVLCAHNIVLTTYFLRIQASMILNLSTLARLCLCHPLEANK